jgi:hypothetical protein
MAPMIFVISTPGHDYTSNALRQWPFGGEVPFVRSADYGKLFRSETLPRATYVFADIDRLYAWERRLAAEMYRAMVAAGLRCLNDPARVLTRYPLLRALAREGINPFDVYRADDAPQPRRFPVFIRTEAGHDNPQEKLFETQAELDQVLARLVRRGIPLANLLVIEFVDLKDSRGFYSKFGAHKLGGPLHYDHASLSDKWVVKRPKGSERFWTEAMQAEERRTVIANEVPDAVRRAFEIAGIEWGRADYGRSGDRSVVFEINTNPNLSALSPEPASFREETRLIGRRRMAQLILEIDTKEPGPPVRIEHGEQVTKYRRGLPATGGPPRRP